MTDEHHDALLPCITVFGVIRIIQNVRRRMSKAEY